MAETSDHIVFDQSGSYVGRTLSRPGAKRAAMGRGRYTDDIQVARTLHAAFLRSPYAHARILNIDTVAASEMSGVVRIVTGNGGGYGDPSERSRDRIIDDIKNGYLTKERAREVYGFDAPAQ